MKEEKRRPFHLYILLVWVLIMLFSIPMIYFSLSKGISEKIKDTELVLESMTHQIEYAINSRLLNLRTLEVLVYHDGGMLMDFERLSRRFYELDDCVRCVQIAPNGVITHIYPLEGNESAFGNLFVNSLRKEEARYARESKIMTMGGPYTLHQGGLGIVARHPIYLETKDGKDVFWGLAIEVIDLPLLLERAGLEDLTKSGFAYRVWHNAPQTGEPTVFYGDEKLPDYPITKEINVPGSVWYLSIVPQAGWISNQTKASAVTIFLVINGLTFVAAYLLIKLSIAKDRHEKSSKTDDLTGIYNSRYFYEKLHELEEIKEPFFLYYMDLNRFKEVNDNYGHEMGNKLLQAFVGRMQEITLKNHILFRIGGDEFAVIKLGTDIWEAESYRNSIYSAMEKSFRIGELYLNNSVSVGYASFPEEGVNAEGVMLLAENRMYEEKARMAEPIAFNKRQSFFNVIKSVIQREKESCGEDKKFYFYHIDYKNFKLINYIYGTKVGDELIRRTMLYIKSLSECLICSGGYSDQIFLVAKKSRDVTDEYVSAKYEEYCQRFIDEEQKNFPDVLLCINCGVSEIYGLDVETAAGRANIGRISAKKRFCGAPVYMDNKSTQDWMNAGFFESGILLAATNKRIFYELQPIISLSEENVVFAEALGRMRDATGETVYPKDFIPVLTKTEGIIQFDLDILKMVCRDINARVEEGKKVIPVSVNLSPLHITNDKTPEKIRSIISQYNIDPKLIHIEITEDILMKDIDKAYEFCKTMHDIGARVLLDDFGAGYMNFELLGKLPIDVVKIDKSLLGNKGDDMEVVKIIMRKILSISQELHIPVICEGVERASQCRWLRENGVEFAQGYYFGKPDDPEVIYDRFL